MAKIPKAHTKPELLVRSLTHRLGFRFRLHDRRLPGTPDLVFRSRKKVIFVHGCWWHRHTCPLGNKTPKSNVDYWEPKLAQNTRRDEYALAALIESGWTALIIWECELPDQDTLAIRIASFLRST